MSDWQKVASCIHVSQADKKWLRISSGAEKGIGVVATSLEVRLGAFCESGIRMMTSHHFLAAAAAGTAAWALFLTRTSSTSS